MVRLQCCIIDLRLKFIANYKCFIGPFLREMFLGHIENQSRREADCATNITHFKNLGVFYNRASRFFSRDQLLNQTQSHIRPKIECGASNRLMNLLISVQKGRSV